MPAEILMFGALGLLLVFMIFNTRRRTKMMREEQETKRAQTVPGAKVMLQGGIYGTIESYDAEDLSAPAFVEIAPGVVIEVHSQAIMRVVDPTEDVEVPDDASGLTEDGEVTIETPEETRARLERDHDDDK